MVNFQLILQDAVLRYPLSSVKPRLPDFSRDAEIMSRHLGRSGLQNPRSR